MERAFTTHSTLGRPGERPQIFGHYLAASLVAQLLWETLQLPLYTLWSTGTVQQQVFAVVHCTIGDVLIAGASLLVAVALFGRLSWPRTGAASVFAASLALGISYTVFSEWLNVHVRESWAYSDLMPNVPMIGTGLAPLMQWLVVPTCALWRAIGRMPWNDAPLDRGQ